MTIVTAKKENVRSMFNNIAKKYDLLNHFLSLGIDRIWRKKLVKLVVGYHPTTVLDVATGTADLAIEVSKQSKANIVGIDIAEVMIEIGKKKITSLKLDQQITLQVADSENIPYPDQTFDAAIVSFGVRNFESLDNGLADMNRVLKTGGVIAILEFSRPRRFPIRNIYMFYFQYILPSLGRAISGDKSAYSYLPESVKQFPDGDDFKLHLTKTGFSKITEKRLSFGIATIYTGIKH